MPLPPLQRGARVAAANAREFAKQALLTGDAERAAADVGAPLAVVQSSPAAKRLAAAVEPVEKALLQSTFPADPAQARAALDSREGRANWLKSIMLGELQILGAFGQMKPANMRDRLAAERLLGLMHGDFVTREEITVRSEVTVFAIPDNGRLPREYVVEAEPAE